MKEERAVSADILERESNKKQRETEGELEAEISVMSSSERQRKDELSRRRWQ